MSSRVKGSDPKSGSIGPLGTPEGRAHSVSLLTCITLGHQLTPTASPVLDQEDHQPLPGSDLVADRGPDNNDISVVGATESITSVEDGQEASLDETHEGSMTEPALEGPA